ncbi:MAG: tRNA (N6-threonylcarbamoyladenosine(37)-N6)-methyltransferase TrmO [Oscillospiraceae bacterium]|nr:tRNA (N6-threonylcarbamoyladenosine(37)-N6)-methyltransferase TrmO [Oscillospiraceae bacterium]
MNLKPIGYIHTDFKEKFGIPRQSGRVPALSGRIVMLPAYARPEAFRGIAEFSHLWLIFDFSQSHRESWSPTVRPPRLGGNQRIGVFATRSPFRPNPIGLSCVKLQEVIFKESGIELLVSGVDLLDGTPILDIKPYLPYADSYPDAVGSYAQTFRDYHLEVDFPEEFLNQIPAEKRQTLCACLAEDPRPSYQEDPERMYHMNFAGFEIHFRVCGQRLEVTGLEPDNKTTG